MDVLSLKKANTRLIGNRIYLYNEIASTNDEAKRLIRLGIPEGAVVLAGSQTKGRGKPGRSWFSPDGLGIYMSILIEPFKFRSKTMLITILGALSAARAIRGLTHLDARVKWPNDIMVHGRKLGGVLTESCKRHSGRTALAVGIGLNVNTPKKAFPDDLKDSATSVAREHGSQVNMPKMTQTLLEEFESLYLDLLNGKDENIINEWMTLSSTIGAKVAADHNGVVTKGIATGISRDGELIIRGDDGRIRKLRSADIIKQETPWH